MRKMRDFKAIMITMEGYEKCFSIEPENENDIIDGDFVGDIVESAILDAKDYTENFDEIVDAIVFELSNNGFIVRDMPLNYETLTFDVETFKLAEIDY
jgi:hypothetical protein